MNEKDFYFKNESCIKTNMKNVNRINIGIKIIARVCCFFKHLFNREVDWVH